MALVDSFVYHHLPLAVTSHLDRGRPIEIDFWWIFSKSRWLGLVDADVDGMWWKPCLEGSWNLKLGTVLPVLLRFLSADASGQKRKDSLEQKHGLGVLIE